MKERRGQEEEDSREEEKESRIKEQVTLLSPSVECAYPLYEGRGSKGSICIELFSQQRCHYCREHKHLHYNVDINCDCRGSFIVGSDVINMRNQSTEGEIVIFTIRMSTLQSIRHERLNWIVKRPDAVCTSTSGKTVAGGTGGGWRASMAAAAAASTSIGASTGQGTAGQGRAVSHGI